MKIVIIGMGMIGRAMLGNLATEGHTITIIDEDKSKIENLIERYDVTGVVGNGACADIQREAGVRSADFVIALTPSDEKNILACMVANTIGADYTIARVRNPEYYAQINDMKDRLGISMIVNPEKETAGEIFDMLNLPSVNQIEHFAGGKVSLVEIVVEDGCALIGESLYGLKDKYDANVLICAVQRGEEVIIPSGNFVIQEGDRINFTADSDSLGGFLSEIRLNKSPLRKVIIVGGDKIAFYLAESLSSTRKRFNVKLIENDTAICEDIASKLPKVTVINGNGTKHDLLIEEGIEDADAFVSLMDNDEQNIIVSMFANSCGVRKTITEVKSNQLVGMLGAIGIENNISAKETVADKVVSYIRAIGNSRGSNVNTLYRLVNNQVEALEFVAKKPSRIYDKPIRDLRFKENCLIACIIREGEVIFPDGNDCIKLNDHVVVVTTHKNFDDLTDVID